MDRFFKKETNSANYIINENFTKATQKVRNMVLYLILNYDFGNKPSFKKELEDLLRTINEIIIENNIPTEDKELEYRDIDIHYSLTISYIIYWLQLYKDKEQIAEIKEKNIDSYIKKYEKLCQ